MIAADGVAEIHAQIGLNSTVCPKNCKFCSFAACNNVRKGKYELPKEDVLEYAKLYVEAVSYTHLSPSSESTAAPASAWSRSSCVAGW